MPKTLDLFTRRYTQITMAFMLFVFVQNFFRIPHSIWIIISGTMIYSGFQPGTVIKRAYLRFTGTFIGVAAVGLMWHLLYLDYRLALPCFLAIIWGCVFFVLLPYNQFIIIVTLLSDILIELPNTEHFYLQYYIFDRLVCTAIAFAMCIGIEYVWFGRSNMMYLHYLDSQSKTKKMLQELYQMTQSHTLNVSKILKKINLVNTQLDALTLIVEDGKYESKRRYRQFQLNANDKKFNIEVIQLFRKIVSIYYLLRHEPTNPQLPLLAQQVDLFLENTN